MMKFSMESRTIMGELQVFVHDTIHVAEEAQQEFLKHAAKVTKSAVKKHIPKDMNRKRRSIAGRRRKRLLDGITSRVLKETSSRPAQMRVQGDRRTGTLWHLADAGTHRSRASHFVDRAWRDVELVIDPMLDMEMNKAMANWMGH